MSALGLAAGGLLAWTPRFHEVQTKVAARMIPTPMSALLATYPEALKEGVRGAGSDQPPTAEDVEDQYGRILALSEARKNPGEIVRELGRLARMVQEITAPGSTMGVDPLRQTFEAFAEERLKWLIVTREPFWSLKSALDPKPKLLEWARLKYHRHGQLREHFDFKTGRRLGQWDDLSVPYALLQLSFSNGVQATANIWILIYRATGDLWSYPSIGSSR
ncbi:MAG: hypothetical protein IPQ13_07445 [Holophagaceae bacterium]|nr:hypothetical protein [Holophagaceae bacterium]